MASEVKWIKIVTDIFDDEKIMLIESMPDADAIIVIWFKLLCLAGKTNTLGVLMMNDRIPYNDEMLAHIFRRPLNTVRMALKIFEKYGMIEIINNTITIPNWGKHQQMDALEKKREYQRKLMQKRRAEQKQIAEQQKLLASCDANGDANVSYLDKEEDIDKEKQVKENGNGDGFDLDPDEAQKTARDHSEIIEAAVNAGFPNNKGTWDRLIDLYAEFGKEIVLQGIRACIDQSVVKPAYLRKCCVNLQNGEGKPENDPLLPKDHELVGW